MVALGTLVREDSASPDTGRLGTIVKVTDIVLNKNSEWKHEVERWISYNDKNGNHKPDMTACYVIRPGKVASVRWQSDPNNLTVHIFYDDCNGRSFYSYGSNGVEVLS